jgi:hypothetical protein
MPGGAFCKFQLTIIKAMLTDTRTATKAEILRNNVHYIKEICRAKTYFDTPNSELTAVVQTTRYSKKSG